jgi:gliding motility-associated lipoprotein GldH
MFFVMAVALATLTSCDNNRVYESYVSVPESGWDKDSVMVFTFEVDKLDQSYDLAINIRNKVDYPNSNLWLFLEIENPSGKVERGKIECILAANNGKWLGKGWGSLYFVRVPFKQQVRFAEEGTYRFRIRQGMRAEVLKGIYSVGLRIDKVN